MRRASTWRAPHPAAHARRTRAAGLLAQGHHGTMGLDGANAEMPRRSANALARARSIDRARASNYGPDGDPLAAQAQKIPARSLSMPAGDDYHDVVKAKLQSWPVHCRKLRGRGKALRRYRAGDGEAAGAAGRTRLAGQAHQSRSAANSAPGCSSARFSPPSICRRTRPSRIIAAPAAIVSMPAPPTLSRRLIGSMRGAASPISPSSIRAHSARIPRPHRQPHLWLRRLPGCLPVEQIRAGRREAAFHARADLRPPTPCRIRAARRCGIPRAVPRLAGQAHRPRPLRPQCADRHRQFGRCFAGRTGGRHLADPRRWCAPWRCGRCRGCSMPMRLRRSGRVTLPAKRTPMRQTDGRTQDFHDLPRAAWGKAMWKRERV